MTQPEQIRRSRPRQAEPEQVIVKKEPEEEIQVKTEPVEDTMTQNLEFVHGQYTPENKTVHCAKVQEESKGENTTTNADSADVGDSRNNIEIYTLYLKLFV